MATRSRRPFILSAARKQQITSTLFIGAALAAIFTVALPCPAFEDPMRRGADMQEKKDAKNGNIERRTKERVKVVVESRNKNAS